VNVNVNIAQTVRCFRLHIFLDVDFFRLRFIMYILWLRC